MKVASPDASLYDPLGARYRVWHVVHHAEMFLMNAVGVYVVGGAPFLPGTVMGSVSGEYGSSADQ
jgi:hypothetical protein